MDKERIRAIAVCLFRRGGRILVSEGYDSAKRDYFCRPLGGGIEFGEHSRDAVRREIGEELGAEVEGLRLLGVLENLFVYEGERGHEIVFVYDGELADESLYGREELGVCESGADAPRSARWRTPAELRREGVRLVPEGVERYLEG